MRVFARALCLAALVSAGGAALADWSGFNRYGAIAELRIEPEGVGVSLHLSDRGMASMARAVGSEAPQFIAASLLKLTDQEGRELAPGPAELRKLEEDGPGAPSSYELDWSYAPATALTALKIVPSGALGPKDLGLIALHRGVPVSDLSALDKPLSLKLDPLDPWRSRYDDPELIRHHAEPRSFVYVEPYEVRHELLIRLAELASVLDLGLGSPGIVQPGERPGLKQKLGTFLASRNPLRVNETALKPLVDRVEFVAFSRTGMQPVPEDRPLDVAGALVGAVIVYLTEQPTRKLDLRWDLFTADSVRRGVSVLLGKESFDAELTRARPDYQWSMDEALEPLAADGGEAEAPAAASASTELGEEPLREVLQALLHNAYRAFQLREEEVVYDRLAKSLADPLLEDIYLQQRRAQLQQAKGLGGEGRVERIQLLEARRVPAPRRGLWERLAAARSAEPASELEVDARWQAQGEVSHWGHSHPRNNLYSGRLGLRRDGEGAWKIARLQFKDGQHLEGATSP